MDLKKTTIKVGILTSKIFSDVLILILSKFILLSLLSVSDTRTPSKSNIDSFDSSGQNLMILINDSNVIESAKVVQYDCVTDDVDKIQVLFYIICPTILVKL